MIRYALTFMLGGTLEERRILSEPLKGAEFNHGVYMIKYGLTFMVGGTVEERIFSELFNGAVTRIPA